MKTLSFSLPRCSRGLLVNKVNDQIKAPAGANFRELPPGVQVAGVGFLIDVFILVIVEIGLIRRDFVEDSASK